MRFRFPASALLAVTSTVLAVISAALAFTLAGSEPRLIATGVLMAAAALGAMLAFGRVAGTVASLSVLVGWAAVAVVTSDVIEPGLSAALGVTVYLAGDTAFESLALRHPVPVGHAGRTPWAPRLLIAGAAAGLSYLLLRLVDQAPTMSPGLAFAAVALTLVTISLIVGLATTRQRSPAGIGGVRRSGS